MFKDFQISKLFDWQNGNTDLKKEHINGKGYPVVSSGVENTGVIGCTDVDARILPAHTITVDMFGNVYYREFEYKEVTHARVFTLIPKGFELDVQTGLYFVSSLKMLSKIYSYDNMCSYAKMSNMTVSLPVIENPNPDHEYTVDDIDWEYMRARITELERARITELERDRITELDAYLQAAGLNDYELTEDDKKILSLSAKRASDENGTLEDNSEDEVRFGKFKATDLFDIKKGKRLTKADMIEGNINFVGSSASNNGITARIGNKEYLHSAHTFTVSYNGSVGEVFLQDEPFWASDDVNVWYPKFPYNQRVVEYIMSVVRQLKDKYSYTAKWTLDKMQAEILELPIKSDGTPDFDYMERYIRAIEKVVIADVVKYKDKVIETTKKVVGE